MSATLPEHLDGLVAEAARKLGVEQSAVWAWIAAHAAVRHAETAPDAPSAL